MCKVIHVQNLGTEISSLTQRLTHFNIIAPPRVTSSENKKFSTFLLMMLSAWDLLSHTLS